ncbi:MAG: hypothetical protein QOF92_1799 [Pseudonocardiales bacterium]|nr:hypothetical protein [Pseudonocardiales bacterium]
MYAVIDASGTYSEAAQRVSIERLSRRLANCFGRVIST